MDAVMQVHATEELDKLAHSPVYPSLPAPPLTAWLSHGLIHWTDASMFTACCDVHTLRCL